MKKILNIMFFVGSLIALLISVCLFYNMGIFVDENNTSPALVLGGNFWNYMSWLRLFILALLTVISGIKLFEE